MDWLIISGFIIGTVIGSFAKASVERMIRQTSFWGRSYCQSCKKNLRWYDLFPVLSFLLLRGRCRYCHKKIPLEDFLFEIGLGAAVAALFGFSLPLDLTSLLNFNLETAVLVLSTLFKMFVIGVLAILFWVDLKTGLLPDRVTYPAAFVAVGYLLLSTILQAVVFYQQIQQSPFAKFLLPPYSAYFIDVVLRLFASSLTNLFSAVIAASIFSLIIVLTKGRGMGWGDVKYVLFLGLALGFPNIAVGLFFSFLIGALFSLLLIVFGKKRFGQTIPFGPFLSLGALIALLFGPQIFNWYLNGFRF